MNYRAIESLSHSFKFVFPRAVLFTDRLGCKLEEIHKHQFKYFGYHAMLQHYKSRRSMQDIVDSFRARRDGSAGGGGGALSGCLEDRLREGGVGDG